MKANELIIEQIVSYACHGLTGYFIKNLDIVTEICFEHKIISSLNHGNCLLKDFKPILHPLSDLTKEIEIDGEKFVPITRLRPDSFNSEGKFSYDYYKQARVFILKNNDTGEELHIYTTNFISVSTRKHIFNVSDYRIIQKLYEWHFDIHNLIGEGLAIDINTLIND